MKVQQLEKELEDATQLFIKETDFMIDTHEGEYLTTQDLDNLRSQVFYAMNSFKDSITKYIKKQSR